MNFFKKNWKLLMLSIAGSLLLMGSPTKVEAQCDGCGTYNYWLQYSGQWPCVQYSANCLILDEDDLIDGG